MLVCLLLNILTTSGYYLGIDISDPIKVKTKQISALQPTRKLSVDNSSLVKFEIQDKVAFKTRRVFSEAALQLILAYPRTGVQDGLTSFGQDFQSLVEHTDEFSVNNLTENKGMIIYSIDHGDGVLNFIPEEIQTMELEYVKSAVLKNLSFTGSVLTVPGFFTQSQRKMLKKLCDMARLAPVGFIYPTTAVALLTGLDRIDESEVFGVVYAMKKRFVEFSLYRFVAAVANIGKLSEKKVEMVELVKSEWNLKFGLEKVERFLARFLVGKIQEKCGKTVSEKENFVKVLIKAQKSLKKFESEDSVKVKFGDIYEDCQTSVEVNKELVEKFFSENSEEILKPVNRLLTPSHNISFFIPSYKSDSFLDSLIESQYQKPLDCNSDSEVSLGSALFGTNFSSEVQIRPVFLSQRFLYSAKVDIVSQTSKFVRSKEIFTKESYFGAVKKVAFSENEDLNIQLSVDYGKGYILVEEWNLTDISYLFEKFDKKANITLVFTIDSFGIISLSNSEAKFEVEVEEVVELSEKEKEKIKKDIEKALLKEGADIKVEKTEEKEEKAEEKIETPKETSEPAQEEAVEAEILEGDSNSTEKNQTEAAEAEPESPKVPQTRMIKKNKTLKYPLSTLKAQIESPTLSNFEFTLSRTLEKFTNHELLHNYLDSARSSLFTYTSSISTLIQTTNLLAYLSPEDSATLSSYLSQSESYSKNPVDTEKPYYTLLNSIKTLVSRAKFRQSEWSNHPQTISSASTQLSTLQDKLQELLLDKPWLPSSSTDPILSQISLFKQWLQNNTQVIPDQDPQVNSLSIQGRLYSISTKIEALQKLLPKADL